MKAKKTKQLESGDHNYRELESVQTIVVLENKMLRLLLLRHFSRVRLQARTLEWVAISFSNA